MIISKVLGYYMQVLPFDTYGIEWVERENVQDIMTWTGGASYCAVRLTEREVSEKYLAETEPQADSVVLGAGPRSATTAAASSSDASLRPRCSRKCINRKVSLLFDDCSMPFNASSPSPSKVPARVSARRRL